MFYQKINDKRIATLHPVVQVKVRQWISKLETAKREVLIAQALRTPREQEDLWEQGRKKPGKVVTNAHGLPVPQSLHCFGVAFDFCPCDAKGNCLWNDTKAFKDYAAIAKMCDLEWGGDWKSFPDFPHLQFLGGHDLAYFQKGGKL